MADKLEEKLVGQLASVMVGSKVGRMAERLVAA